MRARLGVVVSLLLPFAAAPARAVPQVEPELELDERVPAGPPLDQDAPAAASDGTRFLVAWRASGWSGASTIRAAFTTADGQVAPATGFDVSAPTRDPLGRIGVAFGGGTFLVVWDTPAPVGFRATRVSPEGKILDPQGIPLRGGGSAPAVIWNGTSFWLLWSTGGQIQGMRVSTEGKLLDASPVLIGARPPAVGAPAVAFDGARTFVAWTAWSASDNQVEVRAARLGADGVVSEGGGAVLFSMPGYVPTAPPAVAWNGNELLVAAAAGQSSPTTFRREIRTARVQADGRVLDPGTVLWSSDDQPVANSLAVAWTGAHFAVLWESQRQVGLSFGPRLAGRLVGAGSSLELPWTRAGTQAQVVSHAGRAFLFWAEFAGPTLGPLTYDLDVKGMPLDAEAKAAAPPFFVTLGAPMQQRPAVAWSGSEVLVVWEDHRNDAEAADIYGRRLSSTGQPLDAHAIAIATGPGAQTAPAVAWNGREFVVVWHDGERGLGAARVSREGSVLDDPPQVVPGTAGLYRLSAPALCREGDGVLLAWGALNWQDVRTPAEDDLRMLRVPAGATFTQGSGALLSRTTGGGDFWEVIPRLACNDQAATLMWFGQRNSTFRIYAGRIDRGATALAPAGGATIVDASGSTGPGVASDGAGFLGVWTGKIVNGANSFPLLGTRFDGPAHALDVPPLELAPEAGRDAAVLWDGTSYVALYTRYGSNVSRRVEGVRVSSQGAILDRAFPVADGRFDINNPAAVSLGDHRWVVTFDRVMAEETHGTWRVRARFATSDPPPSVDAGADAAVVAPDAEAGAGDASSPDAGVVADGPSGADAATPLGGADAAHVPPAAAPDAAGMEAGFLDGPSIKGDGCGCRVGRRSDGAPGGWSLVLALGLTCVWRRMRRRQVR